jgi:hypothetical protein
MLSIHCVNGSIRDDQCCRGFRLAIRMDGRHEYQTIDREFAFHNLLIDGQTFVRLESAWSR